MVGTAVSDTRRVTYVKCCFPGNFLFNLFVLRAAVFSFDALLWAQWAVHAPRKHVQDQTSSGPFAACRQYFHQAPKTAISTRK